MVNKSKVYVSRLPPAWTESLLREHFGSCFGTVSEAEVFTSRSNKHRPNFTKRGVGHACFAFKNEGKCDRGDSCLFSHDLSTGEEEPQQDEEDGVEGQRTGSGSVTFERQEDAQKAIEQGSIHASKKTIRISSFQSREDGRDENACYAWSKGNCVHGDNCRFSHEGEGSLAKQSDPYHGRKFQCLSWKTKGKCSKGDKCSFLHTDGGNKEKKTKTTRETKGVGICDNFRKKGKCRKGEKCKYSHDLDATKKTKEGEGEKRKRIDGSVLVEKRTKAQK